MKNINWLKITSVIAAIGLVLVSLILFRANLHYLPSFRLSLFFSFVFSIISTISAIYYFSKTNYGSKEEITENKD